MSADFCACAVPPSRSKTRVPMRTVGIRVVGRNGMEREEFWVAGFRLKVGRFAP
jgi:hypothetical protein